MSGKSRLSFPALFLTATVIASRLLGEDRTIKRVEELLMATGADSPQSRLVTTVFGGMSESELADLVVASSSMSIRLRAAEELALHRGDTHPCDSFVELVDAALGVPSPRRFKYSVLNARVFQGQVVPKYGYRPSFGAAEGAGWKMQVPNAGVLTVKIGPNRHAIKVPDSGVVVAAAEVDKAIVCVVFDRSLATDPLLMAIAKESGAEMWRCRARGAGHRGDRDPMIPHHLELVQDGERVYLYGVSETNVYIECYSVSEGAVVGRYRTRMMPSENVGQ